ncbi:MAG: fused MFS/spermidine synthase, partial [Candidatus Berkiella sp.]
ILFFQVSLLLGYCYAFGLAKLFKPSTQATIHLILLCGSLIFIPIYLHSPSSLEGVWSVWAVLLLLTKSILIPCIVVSASSPLLQHWYYQLHQISFPYVFYSISNAGSLIGLFGYPFILEPMMGLKIQRLGWSIGYGVYVLLCLVCLSKLLGSKIQQGPAIKIKRTNLIISFKWLLLTFLSSALLLSTTQFLVQNVINLPLLWVIPLALYLISYIVVFSNNKGYHREFWAASFLTWLVLFLWLFYHAQMGGMNVVIVILAMLFTACMFCHGELVNAKPPSENLTLFYLMIALGGVLGGVFSNIIALLLFVNWWDLFLPLVIVNVLIVLYFAKTYLKTRSKWDLGLNLISIIILIGATLSISMSIFNPAKQIVAKYRNPYGMISVYDDIGQNKTFSFRAIMHGMVIHGLQFLDVKKENLPTTYYGKTAGVGIAFEYLRAKRHPLKVGIIGLGCGTIAAYGEKGDSFTFYEIDMDMAKLAMKKFSFLPTSKATIRVILGDARLRLQNNIPKADEQKYDLLILDAFNGDSIPSHLLTIEAMTVYQQHLAKEGIIAVHTSNTYIDLLPVTKALAQQIGCQHDWIVGLNDPNNGLFYSTWALITCDPNFASWLKRHQVKVQDTQKVSPRLWTDDFNSILPLLIYRG